jgi:hypothetical protein
MVQAYLWSVDVSTGNPVLGTAITNLSSFTATPQEGGRGKDVGVIGIAIVGDKSKGIKTIKVTVDGVLIRLAVLHAKISGTSLNIITDNDGYFASKKLLIQPFTTPDLGVPKGADVAIAISVQGVLQSTISLEITYGNPPESEASNHNLWTWLSQPNHKLWMWLSIGGAGVVLLVIIVALIYWYKTKKAVKTLGYRGMSKRRHH